MDLYDPLNNDGLLILTAPRSKASETEVVTRINIYVPVQDARDYVAGMYRAKLSENKTKIEYTEPKIAMYMWKKPQLVDEADVEKDREPKIMEQHQIVSAQIAKNMDRLKRKRILKAPPGVNL